MGRRPSLARLLRELLAQLQDPRQLEKLVREQKQSPHLRQQFELQMWALYGMVQWGGEHQGHPGWIEGLLRLAKEALRKRIEDDSGLFELLEVDDEPS